MNIIRCDGCGNEVQTNIEPLDLGVMGVVLCVRVGVGAPRDVHACSEACYDRAIAQSVEAAKGTFLRACKELGTFKPGETLPSGSPSRQA